MSCSTCSTRASSGAEPMSVSAPAVAGIPDFQASEGYWRSVLRRFLRNRLGVAAALVVLALLLVALLAPWIAPMDPYAGRTLRRLRPIGTEGFPLGTDELG